MQAYHKEIEFDHYSILAVPSEITIWYNSKNVQISTEICTTVLNKTVQFFVLYKILSYKCFTSFFADQSI